MRIFRLHAFIGVISLYCCLQVALVQAASLAVFPVEDLSQGRNGVNLELTDYLARELQAKGLAVLPRETVIGFMVEQRIRWVGSLDTPNILRFRDTLGTDLILLASISQLWDGPPPLAGITMQLLRTLDGRVIWSHSGGFSAADVRRPLGLEELTSSRQILLELVDTILDEWPDNLDDLGGEPPEFAIETVHLSPKYARPGQPIRCAVRIRAMALAGEPPQVFMKIGEQDAVAMDELPGQIFEGNWPGPKHPGTYPVTLVLRWPTGWEEMTWLGDYQVDDSPPRMSLRLKGTRIEGEVVFREDVTIIPRLLDREPVSRWQISVQNMDGEVLTVEDGPGNLPHHFIWKGTDSNGRQVDEGRYVVVLEVWDRAGNASLISEEVSLDRSIPAADLLVSVDGEDLYIEVLYEGELPINYWTLEIRRDDGEILLQAEGDDLPLEVKVEGAFPKEAIDGGRVRGVLVVRDILGNTLKQDEPDLLLLAEQVSEEELGEGSAADEWISEF